MPTSVAHPTFVLGETGRKVFHFIYIVVVEGESGLTPGETRGIRKRIEYGKKVYSKYFLSRYEGARVYAFKGDGVDGSWEGSIGSLREALRDKD